MLIDEQGRYVAHPDSTRLFNHTIFNVENPQQQSDIIALGYEMTKGKQGSMFVNVDGQNSLVCYRPVSGTPWSLAIVCPESDILQGYNQLTLIVIPLLLVGLFLIVVNCYKAVTVSIHPLSLLLETTRSIAEGDMPKTIPHTERTDVIGGLQNSFATMQESLNSYLESINEASEQNQQYNQELEHTMQMAMESERQKTIFIQSVTHQIRTPLNIIMGFAQVLNNMPKDENPSSGLSSEELKNIVQSMTYNSKQLIRMVLMLYDSSENGQKMTRKLHIEKVAVDATMKEMLNYIHEESPDVDIAYSNSLPDGFCMNTDRRSIGYSIYELLHNAIKYSDKQHISLDVEQEDGRVRFIIQDTGSGISDTNREHIFNFFVKADRYSEGLGLGLPLAMRHAQMLGGQLTLDTGYQEGCRFIFEIPI
jgi:signal transduction histidine kinase